MRKDIPKYYAYLLPQSSAIWDKFLEHQLSDLMKESSPTKHQFQFRQLIAAGSKCATKSPQPEDYTRADTSTIMEEEVQRFSILIVPQLVNINVY